MSSPIRIAIIGLGFAPKAIISRHRNRRRYRNRKEEQQLTFSHKKLHVPEALKCVSAGHSLNTEAFQISTTMTTTIF